MFTKFKAWIWGGIAGVIGILLIAVRVLTKSNSKLREKAENAEANARRRQIVLKADQEIDEHEQETMQTIPDKKPDDDPNSWIWVNKREDD